MTIFGRLPGGISYNNKVVYKLHQVIKVAIKIVIEARHKVGRQALLRITNKV